MKIKTLSPKQREIFSFIKSDDYALICDGSVRSGKTTVMTLAFLLWAMYNFNRTNFAICGKTTQSAERNVLKPLMELEGLPFRLSYKVSTRILAVQCDDRVNWFYLFGGKDESSYMLIQGITLAGVLFDEVALMPQSFVEQALSRAISYENSKYFFNCNPESPNHYFYQEWIEEQKPNTRHIHFSLEDNPILSDAAIERTKAMYSGVFYDRYIKGLWVAADGLIYPMFDKGRHVLKEEPETEGDYYVSSDYGIQNPNVFLLWRKERGTKRWICLKEDYYSGRDERHQLTDAELVDRLDAMLDGISIKRVIIDPSAASMKAELWRRGYHTQDAKNDVINGISDVCSMLGAGNLAFMEGCKNTIAEFGAYLWDSDAVYRGQDVPLKENDHAMDAVRYFVKTMYLVRRSSKRGELSS